MFTISVRETGESFPCGTNETVMAAMLRSRRGPLKCGCFGGGCGVCRMTIDAGRFEKVKRMSRAHVSEADERENVVLVCCVQPRENLIISGGK